MQLGPPWLGRHRLGLGPSAPRWTTACDRTSLPSTGYPLPAHKARSHDTGRGARCALSVSLRLIQGLPPSVSMRVRSLVANRRDSALSHSQGGSEASCRALAVGQRTPRKFDEMCMHAAFNLVHRRREGGAGSGPVFHAPAIRFAADPLWRPRLRPGAIRPTEVFSPCGHHEA